MIAPAADYQAFSVLSSTTMLIQAEAESGPSPMRSRASLAIFIHPAKGKGGIHELLNTPTRRIFHDKIDRHFSEFFALIILGVVHGILNGYVVLAFGARNFFLEL